MSFIPLMYDDMLRTPNFFDQSFGLDLLSLSDDLQPLVTRSELYRSPLHRALGAKPLDEEKDAFRVSVDVQQFKPEEIQVKREEQSVVVEAKHEEQEDEHGSIFRHFVRRYPLPQDFVKDQIRCQLSSDGILTLSTTKKVEEVSEGGVRVVPIMTTLAPAVKDAAAMPAPQVVQASAEEGSSCVCS